MPPLDYILQAKLHLTVFIIIIIIKNKDNDAHYHWSQNVGPQEQDITF